MTLCLSSAVTADYTNVIFRSETKLA